MAGVFELILAGIVDSRERPSIAEMATRLGVVLPRKIRSGTAGRLDWLRTRKVDPRVMAKVEDALAEAGIDSNSTTWSVLDPWLTWYAFSLAETEPEAWPALAPLSEMVDWAMAVERTLAPPLTVRQASALSAAWHENTGGDSAWIDWARRVEGWKRVGKVPSPAEVLHRWPDGTTLSRLRTVEHLREEGEITGHCVGRGGYDAAVTNGSTVILSVRNREGFPVVTLQADPESAVGRGMSFRAVKGPQNSAVLARWAPYVREAWRAVNSRWIVAYEARMKELAAAGKLSSLGEETWRNAEGWRFVVANNEMAGDIASWMGNSPPLSRWEAAKPESYRVRFLLDPEGAPQMMLKEHRYSTEKAFGVDSFTGPGEGDPTPEAKDAFLDWFVPALRRKETELIFLRKVYGFSDGYFVMGSDGIARFRGELIPKGSVLSWLHRGHPQFELGALADAPSALVFATEVDEGPMPDTQAVIEGMEPVGLPAEPEVPDHQSGDVAMNHKSSLAWQWMTGVLRGFPSGTLKTWALWKRSHFKEYLRDNPKRIDTDPDVIPRLLESDDLLEWFFGLEEVHYRRGHPRVNPSFDYAAIEALKNPAVRGAMLARPVGAVGMAIRVDGEPKPDTLRGVLGHPGWAKRYLKDFASFPLLPTDPRLREAVARGNIDWSFWRVKREARGEIGRGDHDPNLPHDVFRSGPSAANIEVRKWWTYLVRHPPQKDVAGWSRDLQEAMNLRSGAGPVVFPKRFAERVRATFDKNAFFGMDEMPWTEWGGGKRPIYVPDLQPTTAQAKSGVGIARIAALKLRRDPLPPHVYWPSRGFPSGGSSRLFVPSLDSPNPFPASDVLLPYPLPKGFMLKGAFQTWWNRLDAAAQQAIRKDLERVRVGLAECWFDQEFRPAILDQPVATVPEDRVGFLWVGITPIDAFDMAMTSRAVELQVDQLPLLGSFPLPGPRGSAGYVLVLPAWCGAFDRFATTAVHKDYRTREGDMA